MFVDTVRNRKYSYPREATGSFRVVIDAASHIKRLPVRIKCFLLFLLFLSLFIYLQIFFRVSRNHLTDYSYLETDKCPACYGHSLCASLRDGHFHLTGWSRIKLLDFTNLKNVHIAQHTEEGHYIVLKKLAHDRELKKVDEDICKDANREVGCDVARVLYITNTGDEIKKMGLLPKHLKGKSYMFACPSYNLLDAVASRYKEKAKPTSPGLLFRDKLQLYATAITNSEPLLLQTFPASEGWPFPEYYGACGRFIAESFEGEPLYNFFNAPWEKRVDLAYQIMKIAVRLTNYEGDYALYWTDLDFENLVVDRSGKVRVIDVEHIVVVDRKSIRTMKPAGWDTLHESVHDECGGENCLLFSTQDLCSHIDSDHNYYAACRNLLHEKAVDKQRGLYGGLLHDMPAHAVDDYDLKHLLQQCVQPQTPQARFKAKDWIISALEKLQNLDPKQIPNANRLA